MKSSKTASTNALTVAITWLRALLGLAFVPGWTVLFSALVILASAFGLVNVATLFIWMWSHGILRFYGVRLESRGVENIPKEGGVILAFNHQSHMDIPAVVGSSLRTVRFGAKIELYKIPIFGAALRAAGTLPIARTQRNEVLKLYKQSANRLKNGFSFALAPEGTRQDEPVIGPFKKGPFIFAASSDAAVVPVVIEGAHAVLPKGKIMVNVGRWHRTIRVQVLPPMRALQRPNEIGDDLPMDIISEFAERVRAAVVDAYSSLQNEREFEI